MSASWMVVVVVIGCAKPEEPPAVVAPVVKVSDPAGPKDGGEFAAAKRIARRIDLTRDFDTGTLTDVGLHAVEVEVKKGEKLRFVVRSEVPGKYEIRQWWPSNGLWAFGADSFTSAEPGAEWTQEGVAEVDAVQLIAIEAPARSRYRVTYSIVR